jgi:hypothetical protein
MLAILTRRTRLLSYTVIRRGCFGLYFERRTENELQREFAKIGGRDDIIDIWRLDMAYYEAQKSMWTKRNATFVEYLDDSS